MKRAITAWWKKYLSKENNTSPTCGCNCSSGIKRMDKLVNELDIN